MCMCMSYISQVFMSAILLHDDSRLIVPEIFLSFHFPRHDDFNVRDATLKLVYIYITHTARVWRGYRYLILIIKFFIDPTINDMYIRD